MDRRRTTPARSSALRIARLVKGVEQAGGPRLIVVGGAGSLFVAPGVTVRESGHVPQGMDPNSGRAHPGVKEPETEQHRLDLPQSGRIF
jgi:putative NADH-flavin reductase